MNLPFSFLKSASRFNASDWWTRAITPDLPIASQLQPRWGDLLAAGRNPAARAALEKVYTVEEGRTNPFLHLSMHLSITEQVSIDQPRGVKAAIERLAQRLNSLHEAHHVAMEALGEMVWEAQRSGRPFDGQGYIDRLMMRATR